MTLRSVDENGKGIPGISFSMESETGEFRDVVIGDNLWVDGLEKRKEVTDKDGYRIRYVVSCGAYAYFP